MGYYDRWGGVPRSVLEKTSSYDQNLLDAGSNEGGINVCMKWLGTDRYDTTEISGLVLHINVTAERKYQDWRVFSIWRGRLLSTTVNGVYNTR